MMPSGGTPVEHCRWMRVPGEGDEEYPVVRRRGPASTSPGFGYTWSIATDGMTTSAISRRHGQDPRHSGPARGQGDVLFSGLARGPHRKWWPMSRRGGTRSSSALRPPPGLSSAAGRVRRGSGLALAAVRRAYPGAILGYQAPTFSIALTRLGARDHQGARFSLRSSILPLRRRRHQMAGVRTCPMRWRTGCSSFR